ncbi:unnamed protein product [Spirodela intermedia]|uniref:DUF7870 domain-containing protein n=1 Tax=Spirodela intermedia TaxID=51605 RepID=A0A7I8IV22_SPIIN|nr:unnamed protein product [Spirodela intermedia]CAA6661855.1 unnamed protein product [Spirodela intermedia]
MLALVTSGDIFDQPFGNNTFDFIFSCCDTVELPKWPASLALEISWIMKSEGFESVLYSLHSFWAVSLALSWLGAANIDGFDPSAKAEEDGSLVAISTNKFSILEHKLKLLYSAEPQIKEDPLKPWITLKRNMEKSFSRYVYIDVDARGYRSSVGSWFEKTVSKEDVIAPYAAWVRNETLSFEMSDDSDQKTEVNGRGMARIRSTEENIQVFDFVEWLKNTVSMADFVVMKLDMKGTEFDLIPASFDTGCHYNRWQKCCPQGRTPNTTIYKQFLQIFSLLRVRGVHVHQWWWLHDHIHFMTDFRVYFFKLIAPQLYFAVIYYLFFSGFQISQIISAQTPLFFMIIHGRL